MCLNMLTVSHVTYFAVSYLLLVLLPFCNVFLLSTEVLQISRLLFGVARDQPRGYFSEFRESEFQH